MMTKDQAQHYNALLAASRPVTITVGVEAIAVRCEDSDVALTVARMIWQACAAGPALDAAIRAAAAAGTPAPTEDSMPGEPVRSWRAAHCAFRGDYGVSRAILLAAIETTQQAREAYQEERTAAYERYRQLVVQGVALAPSDGTDR